MKQFFYIQLGIIFLTTLLLGGLLGVRAGGSALIGGLICLLSNGFFAIVLMRHRGAQAAKQIIKAFYWGEFIKLALTVLLFSLVLKILWVGFLPLLLGFIAAQSSFWVALLLKPNFFKHRI